MDGLVFALVVKARVFVIVAIDEGRETINLQAAVDLCLKLVARM